MWFEFAKKGAIIILHVKSPIFRAAKLKGFTVDYVPAIETTGSHSG